MLVFFIVHIIDAATILDRMTWGQMLFLTYSPTGFVILSVMIALGTFHAINGIRLGVSALMLCYALDVFFEF